jgi:hypothetical protein
MCKICVRIEGVYKNVCRKSVYTNVYKTCISSSEYENMQYINMYAEICTKINPNGKRKIAATFR